MPKKSSTEEFIQKANEIHDNKYDYSLTEYVNSKLPITITCPEHGNFYIIPNRHLNGDKCIKCNPMYVDTEIFIKKSKLKFGDKFDYSLTIYKNNATKIKMKCNIHNVIFDVFPKNHLNGNGGCKICAKESLIPYYESIKIDVKEAIKKLNEIHNYKYDYSEMHEIKTDIKIKIKCPYHGYFYALYHDHLRGGGCGKCRTYGRYTKEQVIDQFNKKHNHKFTYDDFEYISDSIKGLVTCKMHGNFPVTPNQHKRGKGCPKCANKNITTEEFIEKAINKHKDLYDYSKVVYIKSSMKVEILCKKCNNYFLIGANDHLQGNGCPICKLSKGEIRIKEWLNDNNIKYIHQKRFKDCRNKNPLPFDFYLPDHNICIEYDGKQHFEIVARSSNKETNIKNFEITKLHDDIKTKYCEENDIKLIRIPYFNEDNMEDILSEEIC